jgi:hypothetical protein
VDGIVDADTDAGIDDNDRYKIYGDIEKSHKGIGHEG